MTKELKNLAKMKPNSSEFIVKHALWRISRGKRPSWNRHEFLHNWVNNPANVLYMAIDLWGDYLAGGGGHDWRTVKEKAVAIGFKTEDINFLDKRNKPRSPSAPIKRKKKQTQPKGL